MIEEYKFWKETNGWSQGKRIYEVSNLGNVKINGQLVEFDYSVNGYLGIGRKHLHRIVAELFIPNPDNKRCVDHIDGNKHNNRVDNLRWVTYKENNNNPVTLNVLRNKMKTNEVRNKISLSNKGRKWSNESRENFSTTCKDRILSEDTKSKISDASKGRIWINNGIISKFIKENELLNYPDFNKGRLQKY